MDAGARVPPWPPHRRFSGVSRRVSGPADRSAENGKNPPWLKWLDHTADVRMAVWADSAADLFSRAAWGMCSLLTDMSAVRESEALPVSVTADDRDALMVRWLSELNYLHETRRRVFRRFEVRKLSRCRLEAVAHGEPIDGRRHRILREIKAVTYHGLEIGRAEGRWKAQIIFDV